MYGHLMVVSVISYTVHPSVSALEGIFVMQLVIHSLWSPRFRTEYMLLIVSDIEI